MFATTTTTKTVVYNGDCAFEVTYDSSLNVMTPSYSTQLLHQAVKGEEVPIFCDAGIEAADGDYELGENEMMEQDEQDAYEDEDSPEDNDERNRAYYGMEENDADDYNLYRLAMDHHDILAHAEFALVALKDGRPNAIAIAETGTRYGCNHAKDCHRTMVAFVEQRDGDLSKMTIEEREYFDVVRRAAVRLSQSKKIFLKLCVLLDDKYNDEDGKRCERVNRLLPVAVEDLVQVCESLRAVGEANSFLIRTD